MSPPRYPHPPPWWPEGEPWPPRHPSGPPWHRGRRFFVARFGGVLALVLFLSIFGAIALVHTIAGREGPPVRPFAPFVFWALALVFVLAMRRLGRPLADVVSAADRVASGDFTVRVRESGPPWLRSVAAAFNSMTEGLERQRRQRRDLMADIAHELRTPLSVMQGRLEGMLDGVYPADEQHVAQVLEDTRLLARLVEDLRTLAHSESGTLPLEKEPTDLGVLIEEVRTAFRPEADARGVAIETRASADLPLLTIDPLRIREVIANLVANAVRHTPANGLVSIEAALLADTMIVRVRDTGPGIAPGDLPHVFDRFYKGRGSTGSGLGLTIARNLVRAHGGSLDAESEPGEGTTMVVRLPIRQT